MTEEEKKAIKWLENTDLTSYPNDINAIETVLKLVYKQQKEIEQQAKEIERQDRNIHKLNLDKIQQQKEIEVLREENFDAVYIKAVADFKDKIREKIKRYKNELEKNNKNIDYTRKLIYTADETIKKEIQNLEELLEE